MLGNCPFSPQLRGRKMEYELLELSFVSFSYCCVIFNVIDAGVSGHIFSLEIAFNIPPFKLFDGFFSAINEYFQEYCPPNTPSSELYSEHDNPFALFTAGPLMNPVCAVRVRMEKFCQASAEWRCAGVCALRHALYRSTCAGKMGYFSWLRPAEWGREQDFGIIAVQTESRMRGVSCVWQCGEADCKMTAEVNRLLRIHRAG